MPARKMKGVKKSKLVLNEESYILEEQFELNKEELKVIKNWIRKGAAFICLGSEFTYTQQFYKGLRQLMKWPTYNGVAIYDTIYKYQYAFDRPIITISLNDPNNIGKRIDSIKLLDRYRTKTLYSVTYDDEEG